eukprot:14027317-Alexandrium_andersonii.AAC.1
MGADRGTDMDIDIDTDAGTDMDTDMDTIMDTDMIANMDPTRRNRCNNKAPQLNVQRHQSRRHHEEPMTELVHMATACAASCPAQQSTATEEQ